MILVGNQRGGARDLALHLMKAENERVTIHEIRGFVADDLMGAYQESHAISMATRCKQHLYSLSLNPPKDAEASPELFVQTIDRAEERLGLTGQPRTIVFHEKRGSDGNIRTHAHAVWCRINVSEMRAVQMSHDRRTLNDLGRELYREHGWSMPRGFVCDEDSNPRNYSLAEWQQAKRAGRDPAKVKEILQDAWMISDGRAAFAAAIKEHGFILARGDKRGAVAVDHTGEAFPVGRAVKAKAKEVRAKLGDLDTLLSRGEAYGIAATLITDRLEELKDQEARRADEELARIEAEQARNDKSQQERTGYQQKALQDRQAKEETERQSRLRPGWLGLLDRFTGQRARTLAEIDRDRRNAAQRDDQARADLRERQTAIDHALKAKRIQAELDAKSAAQSLDDDIRAMAAGTRQSGDAGGDDARAAFKEKRRRTATAERKKRRSSSRIDLDAGAIENNLDRAAPTALESTGNSHADEPASDPRQVLRNPHSDEGPSRSELLRNPALVLPSLSRTKARFNRTDVLRALTKRISEPQALRDVADAAMRSAELVSRDDPTGEWFTTCDYVSAEEAMHANTQRLAASGGLGVARNHMNAALRSQDRTMQRDFGGTLSDEQRSAIAHVLSDRQLSNVVGLAGAGKSTMLATAMDAWTRQGITVHGAALAGKAADGLQSASNIPSRTLAALETSWAHDNTPIAKGDVLVVDEAGMIGTRQMARLTEKMDEIGAKLVLVGDPEQLQPIEAGQPFREIVDSHGAARLNTIHRQKADWQKSASRMLAEGQTRGALDRYAQHGAIAAAPRQDDAIAALASQYVQDERRDDPGTTRLALAHRRKDVHALNQAIRAARRIDQNPASLIETETGPRAFAEGDRIVFGKNDREIGVKNGTLGTVLKAEHSHFAVKLDEDAGTIKFDPREYRHIDHGYAVTIHKSQGATVDQAYVLGSRSMDEHLAYVAMTRHRENVAMFASHEDRPKWLPRHDRLRSVGPEPNSVDRQDFSMRDGPSSLC